LRLFGVCVTICRGLRPLRRLICGRRVTEALLNNRLSLPGIKSVQRENECGTGIVFTVCAVSKTPASHSWLRIEDVEPITRGADVLGFNPQADDDFRICGKDPATLQVLRQIFGGTENTPGNGRIGGVG